MVDQDYIDKTAAYVKKKFIGEGTGHDWWHMYRVWELAKQINKTEPEANPIIVELAALLHDIADWKFNDGDMEAGPKAAREWLVSINVTEEYILKIEDIIRNVSFKAAGIESNMKTIEGKIVNDADKLDAMGAIGIARTFAYGGAKSREMYNPEVPPVEHLSFEEYRKSTGTSINHFYEKLLLLKERMYTKKGQSLAYNRHAYMEKYLEEFYREWSGKS